MLDAMAAAIILENWSARLRTPGRSMHSGIQHLLDIESTPLAELEAILSRPIACWPTPAPAAWPAPVA